MEDYDTIEQPEGCGAMKNKHSLSPMEMDVANVVLGRLETMAEDEKKKIAKP